MMAYLARVMNGHLRVYPLQGYVLPKAWSFVSYQMGAAAVNNDREQAVIAARATYTGKWGTLSQRRFAASASRENLTTRRRPA